METLEEKELVVTEIVIDLKTGEILTPLKWDVVKKKYLPTSKEALSVWELHLIEGSARLCTWAINNALKKGYR